MRSAALDYLEHLRVKDAERIFLWMRYYMIQHTVKAKVFFEIQKKKKIDKNKYWP